MLNVQGIKFILHIYKYHVRKDLSFFNIQYKLLIIFVIYYLYMSIFNFKIRDDGKLPQTICPGCNIQLEATAQFFDLLVVGQRKLRELWKYQVEQQRRAERLRNKKESAEFGTEAEGVEVDNMTACNEDEQYEQQIIIKSNLLFFHTYFVS